MLFTGLTIILFATSVIYVDGAPCLSSSFTVTTEGCSYRALIEELGASLEEVGCEHDPEEELIMQLGNPDPEALISDLCGVEWDIKKASFEDFDTILQENSSVFTKAFFDGETNLNALTETEDNNGVVKFSLDDFNAYAESTLLNVAEKKGINLPVGDNMVNFDMCELSAIMCCWSRDRQEGDGNGNCGEEDKPECFDADPADNVDICYTDMSRSPTSAHVEGGFAIFPGESEGDAHCHGFAWPEDENELMNVYKGNVLFFVSLFDHLSERGYVNSLPGAPMCACLEQMPVVDRADCTEVVVDQTAVFSITAGQVAVTLDDPVLIEFESCEGVVEGEAPNDLGAFYDRLVVEELLPDLAQQEFLNHVVGDDACDTAIKRFLSSAV